MAKRKRAHRSRRLPSNSADPAGSSSGPRFEEALAKFAGLAVFSLGDDYDVAVLALPDGRYTVVGTHIPTGKRIACQPVSVEDILAGIGFLDPPQM